MKSNHPSFWLDRGADGPKLSGYICVGRGFETTPIIDRLGIKIYDLYRGPDDFSRGYIGDSPDTFYYLSEAKFNELFPMASPMTETETKMKNITKAKLKFRVHSPEHSRAIQEKLFSMGGVWCGLEGNNVSYTNMGFLFFDNMELSYIDDRGYFLTHENTEATLDDLFKYEKPQEKTLRLNSLYSATVDAEGVKVGCQIFTHAKILELAEIVKNFG